MKRFAAKARLTVIRSEIDDIFRLFPELRRRRAASASRSFYLRRSSSTRRVHAEEPRSGRVRMLS